ncbi:SDR family oxidoreductase [Cellulomonas hominis]|uniref:NAD(P)-dependent dehydrogenase (Short-subunit alcohol dehydrogenase family) n=1 Tax=Cellulomonas hominis TaxID=156981 RepID=A0A511F8Z4_9CELL|nr:SDR family oxidoreductase [Cellulomonas hominis]MBB5471909.1 NAD(P)-dependent dehydrogenase (short-subunit alcohol dehydrogenase family) [Cellulomonas hominis]MBU5424698.1 SDR family oxidoreductase [Cellulomonas hominis]NKY07269.1 SDR family oxidoreductase [Cellulomonas hominis]GEL45751.1 oxidoreductase [Cellulomonas hominis]
MELGLTDKRAFVSGSTQGIGYAIAAALLAEGAEVVVNGRDEHRVADAVARLRADAPGAAVSGIAADFADAVQVEQLLDELGDVDVLVNNVGVFEVAPFDRITDADWQRYLDVNLLSGVRLARRLLGPMLARGWGRVLFISSESGVDVPADMTHYGVTKAGALALGNGLAKLTRGTGVTVNTILGGPTYSDGVAQAVDGIAHAQGVPASDLKDVLAAARTTSLLQRFIEPEEIARLALYLASPLSSATNGAAVRADGGVLTTLL